MNITITTPRHFRLYGAVLAMAALLAVLLAVTLTDAQAQVGTGPGPLPRTGYNAAEHDNPLPCTEESLPDASTAPLISEGYYAVFDAFWDYEDGHQSNNFCPPEVTVTTEVDEVEEEVTVYTRTDANIHISKTAFSIPDSYKVTVIDSRPTTVNGNPGNVTGPTIDLADFPFLAEDDAVSAVKTENGSTVFANNTLWWVRLDDPGTTADDTSPLRIGFSTALLNEADWHNPNGDPVQFEFQFVHVPHPGAYMFAFDPGASQSRAQWSSVNTNINAVKMQTGHYRQMQFAFTQPGEYRVQAQWKGYVQHTPPAGASPDWIPVSPDSVITSPVQTYTFYVGPLTLNRSPVFGIERSVPENSAAGVAVGAPVPVLQQDPGDAHNFNLTGSGADKFTLSTKSDGVQIMVASGAVLNYEDFSSYDLNLTVSDGKGRLGNADASVDDSIPVRIVVQDDPNEQLTITLEADLTTQTIGQDVRLTARVHNSPVASDRLSYLHHEQNVGGGDSLAELTHYATRTVTWNGAPLSREYDIMVFVTSDGHNEQQAISGKVVIAWTQ